MPDDTTLELKNVAFSYDSQQNKCFSEINIVIEKSDILCIVGPSGSGKSTLLDLILGLREPTEGQILFAGHLLNQDNVLKLHQSVAIVPQIPFIQSGTVKENIVFGYGQPSNDCDMDYINHVCKIALVDDFIKDFPNGLDQYIGGLCEIKWRSVSKLAIARALYQNKKILVLDEPSSALDNDSENRLKSNIQWLSNTGVSIIMITHSKNLQQIATKVISLNLNE